MNEREYAKLRAQAIEQYAGSPITPLRSRDDLLGKWEMRFRGPFSSNKVQWVYEFLPDGTVMVGKELERWRLNKNGTLSVFFTTPPDPTIPGLEEGATTEELYYAFKTADGRNLLSNEDTSGIQVLTRTGGRRHRK